MWGISISILLTLLLTCILSSILTLMLVLDTKTPEYLPSLQHVRPAKTHIALIDGRGNVQDYTLHHNFTLLSNDNESLEVPGSQYGFTAFEDHRSNYFLYGDFKLGICTDLVQNLGKLLPQSQPPRRFLYHSRKLRVGPYFWILDTLAQPEGQDSGSWHYYFQMGLEPKFTNQTMIWSIKRQTWLHGPAINLTFTESCPVAVNRTVVALVGFKGIEMFDFETMKWTHLTDLDKVPHVKYEFSKLVCTLIQNKNRERLIFSIQYATDLRTEFMDHKKDMLLAYNLDQNTTEYQEFTLKYRGLLVNVKGAPFYFRLNQELIGHYYQQKSKLWYKINGVSKSNQTLLLRNVMVHYDHNRNNEFASCKGLKNLGSVTQEPPTNTTFWQ